MAEAESTLERLEGLREREMNLELDVIENLLDELGNPQDQFDAVHVAGTNGKGSVCAFLANMLHSAGQHVGTYASPHVFQLTERIRVGREDVDQDAFADLAQRVMDQADDAGIEATFFETLTAMAFLHFAEQDVDYAVIEAGLGGNKDATNVLQDPEATVITNIGIEHAEHLGSSDEQIAREKAGILRQGVPVVTGAEGLALKSVWSEAAKRRAPLKVLRSLGSPEIVSNDLDGVTFTIPDSPFGELSCPMPGEHMASNAALATHTFQLLREEGDLETSDGDVAAGIEATDLPGRMDVAQKEPAFLIDGAHNPDAVKTLRSFLQEMGFERYFIMFGALRDKDYGSMMEIMAPESREVFVTKPPGSGDRGLNAKALAGEAERHCSRVRTVHNIQTALKTMLGTADPEDAVVVFGSFYLAGRVLEIAPELVG
jgi:dihydrofolate synthase/folylpolyglutamate synthase